ncbi:hypothetical protein ACFOYU_02155 [Microvirga sp. GCM10011540]|uniref:hypothetical protein n=1 Tax=Microvirga sp. GCM10011540 TaxID=3317338 RepID=UPI00361544B3
MINIRLSDGRIVPWPEGKPLPRGARFNASVVLRDNAPSGSRVFLHDETEKALAGLHPDYKSKLVYWEGKLGSKEPFALENAATNLMTLAAQVGGTAGQYITGLAKGAKAQAAQIRKEHQA